MKIQFRTFSGMSSRAICRLSGQLLLGILLGIGDPAAGAMDLVTTIRGNISPKSIGCSPGGLFFAQNMMYRHTVTVYDREFQLLGTISDRVDLGKFLGGRYTGSYRGAPVEVTFTDSGRYAWVSNYLVTGSGFTHPGNDTCASLPVHDWDIGFVYRIDTKTLTVSGVAPAGCVPKYLAATPDGRYVLVSNWCSGDVSVIDAGRVAEVKRVRVGRYPRGIAPDPSSGKAYIAVMGSYDIAVLHLDDFSLTWLRGIGRSPRHLVIDSAGAFLYATLNGEGNVAKVDLRSGRVVRKVATGEAPRSMTISAGGDYLYVVNYKSDTVSKIRTTDMAVVQTSATAPHPIGITYDPLARRIWVACYSGSIMVFQD